MNIQHKFLLALTLLNLNTFITAGRDVLTVLCSLPLFSLVCVPNSKANGTTVVSLMAAPRVSLQSVQLQERLLEVEKQRDTAMAEAAALRSGIATAYAAMIME